MASSFFALFDDIATLLDDISVMTKVATKKTAGVLGDDLALNAQQVTGIRAERELPVVWAVAKGSLVNKAILVPAALAIAALEAWLKSRGIGIPLILPLLMLGGAYLCYEGVEKLAHRFLHKGDDAEHHDHAGAGGGRPVDGHGRVRARQDPRRDPHRLHPVRRDHRDHPGHRGHPAVPQAARRAGGDRADHDRRACTGWSAASSSWTTSACAWPAPAPGATSAALGRAILAFAPKLMQFLSVAGTAAMFLVGGGILVHGIPLLHHWAQAAHALPPGWLWENLFNAVAGVVAGALVLGAVTAVIRLRGPRPAAGTESPPDTRRSFF